MTSKATQYLIYTLFFLLPWQTVYLLREVFVGGEKWHYGTISIYATQVIALLIICCSGWMHHTQVCKWLKVRAWMQPSLFLSCVAICLYIIMSALWSADPLLTLLYGVKIAVGFLLVLAITSARYDTRYVLGTLVGGFTLSALLAIGQFALQGDFSSTLLGLSKHEAFQGGVSVIEADGGRWLRAYGSFPHPNMLGAVMATATILSIGGLMSYGKQRCWRRFFLITMTVCFTALLMSFSRSGLIALIVGILLAQQRNELQINMAVLKKISIGLAGTCAMMVAVLWITYSDLYTTRAQADARLERLSINERTSQVGEALEVIKSNPILGTGAGTYTKYLAEIDQNAEPIWKYQPVHNTPLLIIAELGVIGVALVILIGVQAVVKIRKNIARAVEKGHIIKVAMVGVLITYLTAAMFDHWQWDHHMGTLLLAILIAYACGMHDKTERSL